MSTRAPIAKFVALACSHPDPPYARNSVSRVELKTSQAILQRVAIGPVTACCISFATDVLFARKLGRSGDVSLPCRGLRLLIGWLSLLPRYKP
ncbi:unnamed protein product [Closterium sp. Naga37s-1]|nr:unnamed protein product [Closterium sp. Naga37s-1]